MLSVPLSPFGSKQRSPADGTAREAQHRSDTQFAAALKLRAESKLESVRDGSSFQNTVLYQAGDSESFEVQTKKQTATIKSSLSGWTCLCQLEGSSQFDRNPDLLFHIVCALAPTELEFGERVVSNWKIYTVQDRHADLRLRRPWRRKARRFCAKREQLESFVRCEPAEHYDESLPIFLGTILKMELLLHPIDRELGIAEDEALELERTQHGSDLGIEQGVETGADYSERCHELPDPQLFPSSAEFVAIGEGLRVARGQDNVVPVPVADEEELIQVGEVFACRTVVITARIASSSS
jgi:hypothetical protein